MLRLGAEVNRFEVPALCTNCPVVALRVAELLTRNVPEATFRTVVLLVDFMILYLLGAVRVAHLSMG